MNDARLWRDYERGMVGYQLEGKPRLLLDPDEAREKANQLEHLLAETADNARHHEFIATLRAYAAEVEGA